MNKLIFLLPGKWQIHVVVYGETSRSAGSRPPMVNPGKLCSGVAELAPDFIIGDVFLKFFILVYLCILLHLWDAFQFFYSCFKKKNIVVDLYAQH